MFWTPIDIVAFATYLEVEIGTYGFILSEERQEEITQEIMNQFIEIPYPYDEKIDGKKTIDELVEIDIKAGCYKRAKFICKAINEDEKNQNNNPTAIPRLRKYK